MRWLFSLLLGSVFLAVTFPGSARATPLVPDFSNGEVIFDFEDGLQGWKPLGSAQRLNTRTLNGLWAVFAEAQFSERNGISLEIDLSNVAAIQLDSLFFGDLQELGRLLLLLESGGASDVLRFFPEPGESAPSPRMLKVDVSDIEGPWKVSILWTHDLIAVGRLGPIPGVIDNITLVPIPEPTTVGLLSMGLALLVASLPESRLGSG